MNALFLHSRVELNGQLDIAHAQAGPVDGARDHGLLSVLAAPGAEDFTVLCEAHYEERTGGADCNITDRAPCF